MLSEGFFGPQLRLKYDAQLTDYDRSTFYTNEGPKAIRGAFPRHVKTLHADLVPRLGPGYTDYAVSAELSGRQ